MNKEQLERELLLEQSGELSPSRQKRLQDYLTHSPDARRLRDELRLLTDAVRSHDREITVDESVIAHIMNQAERGVKTPPGNLTWLLPRVIGAAAGLAALFLAGWLLLQAPIQSIQQVAQSTPKVETVAEDPLAWDDDFDEKLAELESVYVMNFSEDVESNDTTEAYDTESIARELLLLEGESI